MCTKLNKKKGCLFCDSPGEARDIVINLAKLGMKIFEVSLDDEDRKDMGFRVVRLDISKIPRGAWDQLIKMAS